MIRNLAMPLALLLTFSTFSLAQPRERMGREQIRQAPGEPLLEELNLTEKQEKEMQNLRLDMQKKQTQIQSQIKLQRLEMKGLFQEDKPDRSAIEKSQKIISDLQYQARQARTDHWFAVLSILTPEQQKIWKRHAGRFGEGRRPRMGDRMHRRMKLREHQQGWSRPMDDDNN